MVRAARTDAGDDEPRRSTERRWQPILEQQERRGSRAAVADVEPNGHPRARRDARLRQVPRRRDLPGARPQEEARDEGQQQEPDPDRFEARRPQEPSG